MEKLRQSASRVTQLIGEFYCQRIIGIRPEFPELNPLALALLVRSSKSRVKKNESEISGFPIPKTGPVILTGNHFQDEDIYKLCIAGKNMAGRLIRAVCKMSLVKEDVTESEEYLKSIDAFKEDDLSKYDPKRGFVLRGIGCIGLLRDHPDRPFLKACKTVLNTNQILGMFLQPTRDDQCRLIHLEKGIASLAKRFPNVPIHLFATSGPPVIKKDRLTFFEPITYAQKVVEYGRELTDAEFTILMADIVATDLPKSSQKHWQEIRTSELQRLTGK